MIVEFVVAKGKKEAGRTHVRVENGALVDSGDGAAPETADVVFTMTPVDAEAVRAGSLELAVGFQRGQIKMAGDFGAVLQLLPLTIGADAPLHVATLVPAPA